MHTPRFSWFALAVSTLTFLASIPLFTQFKSISELSLVKSLIHVEPETASRDIDVANAFIALVLDAMTSSVRGMVEAFMNTPDPGWREDKKRPGILFPQTVIHAVLGPRSES